MTQKTVIASTSTRTRICAWSVKFYMGNLVWIVVEKDSTLRTVRRWSRKRMPSVKPTACNRPDIRQKRGDYDP